MREISGERVVKGIRVVWWGVVVDEKDGWGGLVGNKSLAAWWLREGREVWVGLCVWSKIVSRRERSSVI